MRNFSTFGLLSFVMITSISCSRHVPVSKYEIWASDQSNTVAGESGRGLKGGYIWVWDQQDVESQLQGGALARPLGCDGKNMAGDGPCDIQDVFPGSLEEHDGNGKTGKTLDQLPGFGRLHGMLPDPQNRYMNANIFAPGGGFVGIIDGETKEAVALFRATQSNTGRSMHMSFWNSDGSALLLANLHGRILERIDIERAPDGKITGAVFNKSASLGVGKNQSIEESATAFVGQNAQGRNLVSRVAGEYNTDAFSDLTPAGACKENDCSAGINGTKGGRPKNVIVCPIVSDNGNAYVTFGGGGLLVADTHSTPMKIVGEYGKQVVNGAGCGGIQVADQMYLNAGVSAGSGGADWSMFTVYSIDDSAFSDQASPENLPEPVQLFTDSGNTATGGNSSGTPSNTSGQLPGISTRRDAHGAVATVSGKYLHNADRIQNNVEVFEISNGARTRYDLTSSNGQGNGQGACAAASVSDDPKLPANDPAPDLMDRTPDGKYLVVALRGPAPVSVAHSAQGSCPGVGIIELLDEGATGRLAGVLRTTNQIDTAPSSAPGGHPYAGTERSDPHGAAVRAK